MPVTIVVKNAMNLVLLAVPACSAWWTMLLKNLPEPHKVMVNRDNPEVMVKPHKVKVKRDLPEPHKVKVKVKRCLPNKHSLKLLEINHGEIHDLVETEVEVFRVLVKTH